MSARAAAALALAARRGVAGRLRRVHSLPDAAAASRRRTSRPGTRVAICYNGLAHVPAGRAGRGAEGMPRRHHRRAASIPTISCNTARCCCRRARLSRARRRNSRSRRNSRLTPPSDGAIYLTVRLSYIREEQTCSTPALRPTPSESLYRRLGGYDAHRRIRRRLMPRLYNDPTLWVYWKGKSVDSRRKGEQLLVDFLVRRVRRPGILCRPRHEVVASGPRDHAAGMGNHLATHRRHLRCARGARTRTGGCHGGHGELEMGHRGGAVPGGSRIRTCAHGPVAAGTVRLPSETARTRPAPAASATGRQAARRDFRGPVGPDPARHHRAAGARAVLGHAARRTVTMSRRRRSRSIWRCSNGAA